MLRSSGMNATRIGSVVLALMTAGLAATTAGCYVEDEAPPPAYVADDYAPMYYNGYAVYYDDYGRPFYYGDGAVIWVPPTAGIYVGLVNHWRLHRWAYGRWYHAHPYAHYGFHGGYHGGYRR
jgi:hypothetical protein